MTLGSPTSPKLNPGAQFLPGFLMGDIPAPATPQPRPFSLSMPLIESPCTPRGEHKDTLPTHNIDVALIFCCLTIVIFLMQGIVVEWAPPHSQSSTPPRIKVALRLFAVSATIWFLWGRRIVHIKL